MALFEPRSRAYRSFAECLRAFGGKEWLSLMNDEEKQKAIQKIWLQLLDENSKRKPDERRIMQLLDELTIVRFGALIPEETDFTEEEIKQFQAELDKRKNKKPAVEDK